MLDVLTPSCPSPLMPKEELKGVFILLASSTPCVFATLPCVPLASRREWIGVLHVSRQCQKSILQITIGTRLQIECVEVDVAERR